jgi:hypothetical protein
MDPPSRLVVVYTIYRTAARVNDILAIRLNIPKREINIAKTYIRSGREQAMRNSFLPNVRFAQKAP